MSFNPTSRTTNEKVGFIVLDVKLSASSSKTVTVNYATGGLADTATAGSDYTSNSGTLTYPAGTTSQSIVVEILDDAVSDDGEVFMVILSNATNAVVGDSCTVTIENGAGSSPATVAFEYSGWTCNETSGTVTITVLMTGSPAGDVSVDYKTWDESATVNSDYYSGSGTLTWSKNDSGKTKCFTISVINDSDVESTESVFLVLTNPVNAALALPSAALFNILDDDTVCE